MINSVTTISVKLFQFCNASVFELLERLMQTGNALAVRAEGETVSTFAAYLLY
jgi:hypothetical protein